MSAWILVLIMTAYSGSIASVEFHSEQSCKAAAQMIYEKVRANVHLVCVKK